MGMLFTALTITLAMALQENRLLMTQLSIISAAAALPAIL